MNTYNFVWVIYSQLAMQASVRLELERFIPSLLGSFVGHYNSIVVMDTAT